MSDVRPRVPIDAIGDPVQITLEGGSILSVNAAWEGQLGYEGVTVPGLDFYDLVHPEDGDHCREIAAQVVRGSTLAFDVRIAASDGEYVSFEGTSSRGEGDSIVTVLRDVTEQKRVVALMAQSEQRFRVLNLNAPVGIFETDADGDCTYVNECWCEMTGLSPVSALGSGWREAVHPADRDAVFKEWAASVREKREFVLEYRYRNVVTRKPVWLHCRAVPLELNPGSPVGYLGIAIDLTARKQAETALAESEARFRDLIESSLGLICTHDLGGRLLMVNPAVAQVLGYEPESLAGRSLADITPPRLHSHVAVYLNRIRENGEDQGLLVVLTAGGEERILSYHNILRRDASGVAYVLGHAQDVTVLKRTEERVRALSLTDELTGLANRRGFLLLAEQQFRVIRSARIPQAMVVVFGDLNGLKAINDTMGHEAGDAAIRECARLLRESCRESDVVARLGGDEFAILAISASSDPESILSRIRSVFDAHGGSPPLAISLGARAVTSGDGRSLEEMLAEADSAMYADKQKTRRTAH